jgi:hypothetical protein
MLFLSNAGANKIATAPSRILQLVRTFDRNIEAYRSQQYKEVQLRREFIDPFFEELGWDVTNKSGYAEAYIDNLVYELYGLTTDEIKIIKQSL